MATLLHTLRYLAGITRRAKDGLWSLARNDAVCVIFLVLIAALLRFPLIGHPAVTQYDEVTYANYVMHMQDGRPFVDIHPPLARMIFTEVARTAEPFQTTGLDMTFNQPAGDFPLSRERTFVALLGTLLPLIIYVIGRVLAYAPRVALLLGLFVATDNALISFSRVMLPDMLLLFFVFLSLMFGLFAIRTRSTGSHTYVLLAALSVGCAIAIKWTALGMLLVLLLMFLRRGRYFAMVSTSLVAAMVYLSVFVILLVHYFPMGGMSSNLANESDVTKLWVSHVEFPKVDGIASAVRFIPPLHILMMKGNTDPLLVSAILKSQGAYSWPIARNAMVFWHDSSSGKSIIVSGNDVLWVICFFVFIFDLLWVSTSAVKTKRIPVDWYELLLIAGYVANFLPFFFIERPMYLYHYFIALIFLILLLPKVTPRIVHCLEETSRDALFARTFVVLATILIFVNFLFNIPLTYGY